MGVGPSGRAGPGTGPRTAAASGTGDGQSESSISKKGLALAPFPRQRDCPQCPLPGLRGSITPPRLPAPGKGSQTHPSGTYTEPFPKAVCPQGLSNMCQEPPTLGIWHRDVPRVTFVARLATGPGLPWLRCCRRCRVTAKICSGESRSEQPRAEMAHMDLCGERGGWLSQAGPQTPPSPPRGAPRAHHADAVTGILQRPAQQLQHHLTVQEPTPAQGRESQSPAAPSHPQSPGKGSDCPRSSPSPREPLTLTP